MFAGNVMGVRSLPSRQEVTKAETRWKTRALIQTDHHFCRHARQMRHKWTKLGEPKVPTVTSEQSSGWRHYSFSSLEVWEWWPREDDITSANGARCEGAEVNKRERNKEEINSDKWWRREETGQRARGRKRGMEGIWNTPHGRTHACFVYVLISRFFSLSRWKKKPKHQNPASGPLIRFQSNQTFMEFWEARKVKWNRWMEKVEPKGLRLWLFAGPVT